MPGSRREQLIEKWLPFWRSLSQDEKILYYNFWELGGLAVMHSFEAQMAHDTMPARNREFMNSHLSDADKSYLDSHSSKQWHLGLIAELSIRSSSTDEIDVYWKEYTERFKTAGATSEPELSSLIITVDKALWKVVARDPRALWRLTDRQFEELVAELFAQEGYEVQLTKRTRDNGYDIIAVQNSLIEQRLLIECKRKRNPNAKIPVGIVRQTLGALELSREKADKIVLVSTNTYTTEAHRAASGSHLWRILLKDYDDLVEWLGRRR